MIQNFENFKKEISLEFNNEKIENFQKLEKNGEKFQKNKDDIKLFRDSLLKIKQNLDIDSKDIHLYTDSSSANLEISNKLFSQDFQNEIILKYFNFYMTLLDFKYLELEDTNYNQKLSSSINFIFNREIPKAHYKLTESKEKIEVKLN